MAIITISRGSFSRGKEIAEKVAEKLGYECVSREILIEASHFFNVSEKALLKSIHETPSFLERLTHGQDKYLSFFRAALLQHIKKDNVVYHGHAGHLLVPEIAHVLKVRIIADMEDRIALCRAEKGLSREAAVAWLEKADSRRAAWTRYLYKVEVADPNLYDMVLRIGRLRVEGACELICAAAHRPTFQSTPQSIKKICDLALGSHVEAALKKVCEASVTAEDGMVHVRVKGQKIKRSGVTSPKIQATVQEQIRNDLNREIQAVARDIPGVKEVVCDIDSPYCT
ncbi:MAG: cytidylate kinase-like family protein [Deltaproteobacteria bacterium]|nr:MAG: cytidylate kinase-like family protein [Deltaproteobacteria bacterium]